MDILFDLLTPNCFGHLFDHGLHVNLLLETQKRNEEPLKWHNRGILSVQIEASVVCKTVLTDILQHLFIQIKAMNNSICASFVILQNCCILQPHIYH